MEAVKNLQYVQRTYRPIRSGPIPYLFLWKATCVPHSLWPNYHTLPLKWHGRIVGYRKWSISQLGLFKIF